MKAREKMLCLSRAPGLLHSTFRFFYVVAIIALYLSSGFQSASANINDVSDPEREQALERIIEEKIEGASCSAPAPFDDSPYHELHKYAVEIENNYKAVLSQVRREKYDFCYWGTDHTARISASQHFINRAARKAGEGSLIKDSSYEAVLSEAGSELASHYSVVLNYDDVSLNKNSPLYKVKKNAVDIGYTPAMEELLAEGPAGEFRKEVHRRMYCDCMAISFWDFLMR